MNAHYFLAISMLMCAFIFPDSWWLFVMLAIMNFNLAIMQEGIKRK